MATHELMKSQLGRGEEGERRGRGRGTKGWDERGSEGKEKGRHMALRAYFTPIIIALNIQHSPYINPPSLPPHPPPHPLPPPSFFFTGTSAPSFHSLVRYLS